MPGGRPKVPGCAECKHKKRRCTHVAQSPPPAEPELTSPPRESRAPERFDDDQRYRTARTGRRALDGKRRPSPSRTTPSKCARTESPVPRTNTPRPVLQGLLDSWLSALSVQAEVDKAAKLLALAETPTQIASQVQNHARSLACSPVCSLACPPARWHPRPPAGMPDCPYARPPACLHVCPSRSPRRCRITSASSRRKTIELETKLAIAERETTKLEAKLKRAEAAVFKLRMEVADVLRATTPVLACMHPHLRSHARTHADMCSRTRARARSPYLHTPPLIHMHTHTLAR